MKGAIYNGLAFKGKICGVSILRAGEVNVVHETPRSSSLLCRPWKRDCAKSAGACA
jgi:hypothetical protein